MTWLTTSSFEPTLPLHCEPANGVLLWFSSTFHTCVPTPLAFLSNLLGTLSIVAWLFAQLPQIYKNWRLGSTAGLSIAFLVEWFLGDLSNLLGALFTHQATWQVAIGSYYVFVDFCLLVQWMWYEALQHGRPVVQIRTASGDQHNDSGWREGAMEQVVIEGVKPPARPQIIFRQPTFQQEHHGEDTKPTSSLSPGSNSQKLYRVGPPSSMPSPSPRTILMIACLVALARGSPLSTTTAIYVERSEPTALENAGTILSWMSTLLYLGSRLPQIFKNWRRKSTAGLSPHLFIAAFCGNLFYSAALLSNPCAWNDFGAYGGGGWVGESGSDREQWVLAALPFFLGAAGVLGMDASVGAQFLMYREGNKKIVDIDRAAGNRWHWRRVNGWMRGWFPSISEESTPDREALLRPSEDGQTGEGYGGL